MQANESTVTSPRGAEARQETFSDAPCASDNSGALEESAPPASRSPDTPDSATTPVSANEAEKSIDEIREWRRRPHRARGLEIHAQYTAYRLDAAAPSDAIGQTPLQEVLPDGRTFEGLVSPVGKCGVVTALTGATVAMCLSVGGSGFGIVSSADLAYEGELFNGVPDGYGVGTFTTGHVFAGYWVHGAPEGLGQQALALDPNSDVGFGWYHGPHALQLVRPLHTPLPPPPLPMRRPSEQPLLGLYTAGRALEAQRRRQCQHVVSLWAARVCRASVAAAVEARGLAFESWRRAATAQAASCQAACDALRTRGTDPVLKERLDVVVARQQLAKDREVLRQARSAKAQQVQTTTVTCLGIERRSMALMQAELDDLDNELRSVRLARARCDAIHDEIADLRRRIEDRKVELHAMRRRHRPVVQPAPPRRLRSQAALPELPPEESPVIAYVCGVAGCACGVPKDVFRRLGAVWTGHD
ncbi:hypothetical protein ACHHYP_08327 [Achlya hypogyna]|uniref:Uncharacterized protein n=1 Tax=Achlya hypogyna TaxID=1202772 RepID=A0A1V9ZKP6_ACHHY|nr:hypothetical protein ACHHYP_08327 [Achlya hypogyna]